MSERYILIVSLWLKNNDISGFEALERQAAKAIDKFDGRIERAIRISGTEYEGDRLFEIHIVSFPNAEAFPMYRQSSESRNLAVVRDRVISKSVVLAASEVKAYA